MVNDKLISMVNHQNLQRKNSLWIEYKDSILYFKENLDGLHWLFNSSLEPNNDSTENYLHHLETSWSLKMATCYVLITQSLNARVERAPFLEMCPIIWLQSKYIIIIRLKTLLTMSKEHKLWITQVTEGIHISSFKKNIMSRRQSRVPNTWIN